MHNQLLLVSSAATGRHALPWLGVPSFAVDRTHLFAGADTADREAEQPLRVVFQEDFEIKSSSKDGGRLGRWFIRNAPHENAWRQRNGFVYYHEKKWRTTAPGSMLVADFEPVRTAFMLSVDTGWKFGGPGNSRSAVEIGFFDEHGDGYSVEDRRNKQFGLRFHTWRRWKRAKNRVIRLKARTIQEAKTFRTIKIIWDGEGSFHVWKGNDDIAVHVDARFKEFSRVALIAPAPGCNLRLEPRYDNVELRTIGEVAKTLAQEKEASYWENMKLQILPNRKGGLYTTDDATVAFTILAPPPPRGETFTIQNVRIVDVDGKTVHTVKDISLDAKSEYKHAIALKEMIPLGYYEVAFRLSDSAGRISREQSISFAVIPDVELTQPRPESPFGVATHFGRWSNYADLPYVQQKLGISWFRENLRYKYCAKKGKVSSLVQLAQKYNLSWLPLIDYIAAKNGELRDGTFYWDTDIKTLKQCFKIHKGLFKTYEMQNEPNNFGGWKDRFPGPKQWKAESWGQAFVDLGIQMVKSLKEIEPDAVMLWPEIGKGIWLPKFVERWGAKGYIDGVAPHTYLHGALIEKHRFFNEKTFAEYKAFLKRQGIPFNIWVTETGFSSYKPKKKRRHGHSFRPVTQRQQAAMLVRNFMLHFAYGVRRVFWYNLFDNGPERSDPQQNFGLVRHGRPLQPKPAAVAYANLVYLLDHGDFNILGRLKNLPETGEGYVVRVNNQVMAVIWKYRKDGEWAPSDIANFTVQVPTGIQKFTITDIYGRRKFVSNRGKEASVPISQSPIYIQGLPEAAFIFEPIPFER